MLDNIPTTPEPDPFAEFNENSTIMFPVGERHVGWATRDGGYQRIHSHKAIIRTTQAGDNVHVLGVVGADYRLVHNKELFTHVEDTMRKEMHAHELAGVQVIDRIASWGRTCYRQYVFPNIKCLLKNSVRSEIAFRMIVQNGYGGSALRMHAGAIDSYCINGMIRGEYQSMYRKHTKGLMVHGFSEAVRNALSSFTDSQETWQRWASTPVKHQAAMDLFRELASSDKLREGLQNQYLREREVRGDNLWSIYSAMTYYASHADGEFAMRKSVEEQNTTASVMLDRELRVAHWIKTPQWHVLESV